MTQTYMPKWSPNFLVAPHLSVSSQTPGNGVLSTLMARYYADEQWRSSLLKPSPSAMRDWRLMSEPAWVAHNALSSYPRKIRDFAERECIAGIFKESDPGSLSLRIIERNGPDALWAVSLGFFVLEKPDDAGALLNAAIEHAPGAAPEFGGWNNHASLLGGFSTLPGVVPGGKVYDFVRRMAAIRMHDEHRARVLVNFQERFDNTALSLEIIKAAGLGRYSWRWLDPNADPVRLVFATRASAVTWLCESFAPLGLEQASLRAKLTPLRIALRGAQIALIDNAIDAPVPALPVIQMVDQILTQGICSSNLQAHTH